MTCRYCGAEFPLTPDLRECPKCHFALDSTGPQPQVTCACGAQAQPGAKFCKQCGKALNGLKSPNSIALAQASPGPAVSLFGPPPVRPVDSTDAATKARVTRGDVPIDEGEAQRVAVVADGSPLGLGAADTRLEATADGDSGTLSAPSPSAVDPAVHIFLAVQLVLGALFGLSSAQELYHRLGISITYAGSDLILMFRLFAYTIPWIQLVVPLMVWQGKLAPNPWLRVPSIVWPVLLFLGHLAGLANRTIQVDVQSVLPFNGYIPFTIACIGAAVAWFAPLDEKANLDRDGIRKPPGFQAGMAAAALGLAIILRLMIPGPPGINSAINGNQRVEEPLFR